MNIDITKVKGIIFDYGGTLDTAGEHWSEVIWEAYRQSAVIVDKAEFREAYVYAERELARERHILPAHDFNDLLQIKMKIELEFLAKKGLFPPALVDDRAKMIADICYRQAKETVASTIPVLESLSEKYPMVLVSNFYGNIETVLEDFGIRKYFKAIIESAVMGVRKPDPRIFEHGVKALGVLPGETLVIGDSYRKDILPAESIGCQVLWLKGKGWTEEEDAQLHPNIISSLGEVLNVMAG
ncbi:MAG: HAD family hydrolase [Bacteroides sp.]|nr:HAD family hydrolase [Bacteroides sp.]